MPAGIELPALRGSFASAWSSPLTAERLPDERVVEPSIGGCPGASPRGIALPLAGLEDRIGLATLQPFGPPQAEVVDVVLSDRHRLALLQRHVVRRVDQRSGELPVLPVPELEPEELGAAALDREA